MKRIYAITTDNGDVYGIPAEVIADNYAKYYEGYGESYQENYDVMINAFDTKNYVFADWAKNNMEWDDVKNKAFLVRKGEHYDDFQENWVNGQYEYITENTDFNSKEITESSFEKQDEITSCSKDGWIPVEDEERKPEPGKYILLSFSNFSVPMIGQYEEDEEGGVFYVGDCDEDYTCIGNGLYVNAWQQLPEPYRLEGE